ncbi:maleate isomerase [Saccharopolyspora erythraea NRRL 2338]|uniref:Maleate cis-trans isomerase n=2 Tax=Saccharopolyspora erythraea TaxID=1836 RepID=A4FJB6_SACEN|nr:aspartate/glutamate racemase family protein [Saccharopolyspora erythraea]EQD85374.1 Asp/Glu racemase [Saccharopolyspora erythraea D]PFG97810.1 maleate isomerase [Saccharopolyspora erythraea NRRL 2338]QRK87949.1 aspartate/glutamate racemase family protein [Saccharopolyspora erythraea]CAM04141.1 putative maleate cis-trans isomerase [Saccharopolyspora erythraea NRRL 2338]
MTTGVQRRVGLMIPSSNTMMEADFTRGLPDGMTLHTARMYMRDTTRQGEERMLDEFALPAARDLGTVSPDVVVFGCTSAGALRGSDYDARLCAQISEVAGAPAISTIQSVRHAIRATGARRIGVVTPYVDELNAKIKSSIEDDGIEVVRIAGLGITENFTIAQVPRDTIVEFTVATLSDVDVDLVFASCTNFGAMAAIPGITRALGLPVVTSNQAVLAATVASAGQEAAV